MAKSAVAAVGGLAIGLALGVAIGMVLAESDGPTTTAAVDSPTTSDTPQPPPDDATNERPADSTPATSRRHVAAAEVSAAAFFESIDIGTVPRGDGSISGHVRLADGTGVAGVEVSAVPATPPEWDAEDEAAEDDPAAELAANARSLRWERDARVTALTGPDGSFELTGLAASEHGMRASHDSFTLRVEDRAMRRVQPGTVVNFIATPLTKASYVVRGPDGKPVKTAQIQLASGSGTQNRSWTPESEAVHVQAGTFAATATAGDFQELRSPSQQVTFAEGRTDHVVEFDLREVPGLGGTVTREGPEDRQGMQVWMLRTTDGAAPSPGRLAATGKSEHVWNHNRDSRYAFRDLAPGTYALGAARMNSLPDEVVLVEVGDTFVHHDLVVPDFDRDRCVEVAAFAPDGTRVTDLSGVLHWNYEGGSSGRSFSPVVRPDGAVWIPLPSEHDPNVGTHSLDLTSKAYGRVSREFTPGPGARVEIRFEEPAIGNVTIAGYQGSGAEGRVMVAVGTDANAWNGQLMTPDAEGRMQLPPTAPGPHHLTIQATSQFGNGRVLSERAVTLISGHNDITLSLPAFHTLTVELSGTVSGRRVSVSPNDERHGFVPMTPDEHGRAVFDLLPAGEYEIRIFGGGNATKTVTIPGTTLVRF